MRVRWVIVIYAALQTTLACLILPLWEGYDEANHFAYAQHLFEHRAVPVLDQTGLSTEVWRSLSLVPTTDIRDTRRLRYSDYFKLPASEREARRRELRELPLESQHEETGSLNYEAQQAPLAYPFLALMEGALRRVSLPNRVLIMRLVCAFASIALVGAAMRYLARPLGLSPAYTWAAVFLVVSSQSFYAASAHVSNDWLATGLLPVFFAAAAGFAVKPSRVSAFLFGLALCAGLLAKSYFLIFVPFAIAVVLRFSPKSTILLLAGLLPAVPWYVRNLFLHHNLSGLQTGVSQMSQDQILQAFSTVSWPTAMAAISRSILWTASNLGFSAFTLNSMLLLLGAGLILRMRDRTKLRRTEIVVALGTVLFLCVPIYATAVFAAPGEVRPFANWWYTAGLLPGLALLSFKGLEQGGRTGRWIGRAIVLLAVYIMMATYFMRLIPVYTGWEGAGRLSSMRDFYGMGFAEIASRLSETTMASGALILLLATAASITGLVACVGIVSSLEAPSTERTRPESSAPSA